MVGLSREFTNQNQQIATFAGGHALSEHKDDAVLGRLLPQNSRLNIEKGR